MEINLNDVDGASVLNSDLVKWNGETIGFVGDFVVKLKSNYSAVMNDLEFNKLKNNEFAFAKRIFHYV